MLIAMNFGRLSEGLIGSQMLLFNVMGKAPDNGQLFRAEVFEVELDSKVVLHEANDLEKAHGVDDLLGIQIQIVRHILGVDPAFQEARFQLR
jgi:hypothetical protein